MLQHDVLTCLQSIKRRAHAIQDQMVQWRRYFHQYPEVSFKEEQTSKYILDVLASFRVFRLETGIAKNGIVATLTTGKGPVIGIRSDMDALPVMEKNQVSYASKYPGFMHACGHDAHMAILLGIAQLLTEDFHRGTFQGTVKLIFQPAEEDTDEFGKTGAPYFVEAGIVDQLDVALALHMCPWHHTGTIQLNEGPSMANIDNFSLTITGKGGHGGYPQETVDPIWLTSFVLQGIYGLISRKTNPLEVGTISIGSIHGGETPNVIPDSVTIKGTMRSYEQSLRQQLIEELKQVSTLITTFGGKYQLEIENGEPALINHPFLVDQITKILQSNGSNYIIHRAPYGMGGEDFGHFSARIPVAMFFLGCAKHGGMKRALHASDFDIDESALSDGVTMMLATVYHLLATKNLPNILSQKIE